LALITLVQTFALVAVVVGILVVCTPLTVYDETITVAVVTWRCTSIISLWVEYNILLIHHRY